MQESLLGKSRSDFQLMQKYMTLREQVFSIAVAFGVFGMASGAGASPVTIMPSEVPALKELLMKDKEAAMQYEKLKAVADAALLTTPAAIEFLASEGVLEKDPTKLKTRVALGDVKKVEALAWVWLVTGNVNYLNKCRQYLAAWAKTNQSDGNAINESNFEGLIEGYDIVRDSLKPEDQRLVDGWLRDKAAKLLKDPRGQKENWQSHRLEIVGLIALTTHDSAAWKVVDSAYRKHIEVNFNSKGESIDFTRRDAIHYHLYAVRPLLTLACAAARSGDDLFNYRAPNGASLKSAVDFLEPFVDGSKKHIEFAESKVGFDRTRAAAGEAEYKPHPWTPTSAVPLYYEAACLSPKYDSLGSALARKSARAFDGWRSVLNEVASAPR